MQPFLLNTDGDPKNQPDKTSRLNIGVNINSELGSMINEDGNLPLTEYPNTLTPGAIQIGKIPLRDGNSVIFSVITGNSKFATTNRLCRGEIGILSETNNYRVLVRDNGPVVSSGEETNFNWDLNTQIQGTYKVNPDNSITVYWVDNVNPVMQININNPGITVNTYRQITSKDEFDKMFVLAPYTNDSIELVSVDNNGNLPSGVYYTFCVPADSNFNETNGYFPSNPVSIINETSLLPLDEYDGAPANTNTPKSFTIRINNVDNKFSYIRVYVIAKINGNLTVYDHGYQGVSGGVFTYQVNTITAKPTSTLDVLVNKVNWIAKSITQLNSQAYIANLSEKERPNLQPYVNGIKVDYVQEIANIDSTPYSFHKETNIFTQRMFQYDEVYALYLSVIFKDGTESELYHIPGRDNVNNDFPTSVGVYNASEIADISDITAPNYDSYLFQGGGSTDPSPGGQIYRIDNNAKMFHAFDCSDNPSADTNMGYWENQDETYPYTSDWLVKDSSGSTVNTLQGRNVRHHKMPSASKLQANGTVVDFNLLGLELSNIQFPSSLSDEIVGVNIYYAKRNNANRLVFGQASIHPDTFLLNNALASFSDGLGNVSTDYTFSTGGTVELDTINNGGNSSGGSAARNYRFQYGSEKMKKFKMSPFDSMIGDIDPSICSYVKIFKKVISDVQTVYAPGSLNSAGGFGNWNVQMLYQPHTISNITNYSITTRKLYSSAVLAESVPQYPNNSIEPNNAASFGTTTSTIHYRSDKHIFFEFELGIDSNDLYGGNQLRLGSTVSGSYNDKQVAVANLCIFRTNLYQAFDQQEVIYTGVMYPASANWFTTGGTITDIYGGDTFVSWYGHRACGDIVAGMNFDTSLPSSDLNIAGELRILEKYPAESNANINYRHQGNGVYDIYYPKSSAQSVLEVPLLPNGFGNYYGYNTDYSSVNDLRAPSIHPKNTITRFNKYPTRIARTAVDNPESIQDNFRIFLANEYIDLEKSKGEITNIINYDNRLVISCENSTKISTTTDRIKTEEGEAYLGTGNIFQYPPKDLVLTDTGYSGLKYQHSLCLSQYGLFYPDVNSNKVFIFNDKLEPISDSGLSVFLLHNLNITFNNTFRTLVFDKITAWSAGSYSEGAVRKYNNVVYRSVINLNTSVPGTNGNWTILYDTDNFTFNGKDSVFLGLVSGFDGYYRRYFITKKDISIVSNKLNNFKGEFDPNVAYVADVDWFIYEGQIYLSKSGAGTDIVEIYPGEYALPLYFNNSAYFTPNRFTLTYYPDYKGWASWQEFFPDNYTSNRVNFWWTKDNVMFRHNQEDHILITPTSLAQTIIEPIFNQQEPVRLLSTQWKTKALRLSGDEEVLTTFDTIQAYDSYQLSKEFTISNTNNSRNLEGYWSCNDFRDYTLSNTVRVIDNSLWNRPLNNSNINNNKHWSKLKKLVDYWFGMRFTYKPYISTSLTLSGTNRFEGTYSNDTLCEITLTPSVPVNSNDFLELTANGQTFYAKIISNVSTNRWVVKLYSPISFSGPNMTITAAKLITIKPKLHLLDVTKLVIKNIR